MNLNNNSYHIFDLSERRVRSNMDNPSSLTTLNGITAAPESMESTLPECTLPESTLPESTLPECTLSRSGLSGSGLSGLANAQSFIAVPDNLEQNNTALPPDEPLIRPINSQSSGENVKQYEADTRLIHHEPYRKHCFLQSALCQVIEPNKPKKVFECDRCNTSFAQLGHLATHRKSVHGKSKDYMCPVCGHRSATSWNMRSHMKKHSDKSRLYRCDYCERTFVQKNNKYIHEQRVHKKRVYPCEHCNKTFAIPHALIEHRNKTHPSRELLEELLAFADTNHRVPSPDHRHASRAEKRLGRAAMGLAHAANRGLSTCPVRDFRAIVTAALLTRHGRNPTRVREVSENKTVHQKKQAESL